MPTWYGSWSRSREPEPWSKTDRLRNTGWQTDLITLSLLLQFSLLWFVHTEKTWCVGIPLHTVCLILFFTRKKTYTSRPKVCIGKTSEAQTGLFSQSLKIISRKINAQWESAFFSRRRRRGGDGVGRGRGEGGVGRGRGSGVVIHLLSCVMDCLFTFHNCT